MKNVQLKLSVGESAVPVLHETSTGPGVHVFEVCHQPTQFGDIALKQYWIDKRTIYPQRSSKAVNYQPLIDFWWRFRQHDGGLLDNKSCEIYLLASLLTGARSNGSRRVINDATPRRQSNAERQETVQSLDRMLKSSYGEEISIVDFGRKTADQIGPIEYPADVATRSNQFNQELFGDAIDRMRQGRDSEAKTIVNQVWAKWQKRFGRRGGHANEKLVMDILSYEARAAIHHCYSILWGIISKWLEYDPQSTKASTVFHRFWHQELIWPSIEFTDHHFRLFHGHVFALHPSTSFFAQTITGRRLIGDWLQIADLDWQYAGNPETTELKRLLYGIYIAVCDYCQRHGSESDSRKNRISQIPDALEDREIIHVEGSPAKFRSSARRHKKAAD